MKKLMILGGSRYAIPIITYPYLPEGVYAELRSASNLRFQTQEELTRILNRIARWFSIYFPEYKDVYGKSDSKSGLMILEQAPLPADIRALGVDGGNKIWRDAKLRGVGMKRATKLVEAAGHSIGSREGLTTARMEIKNLLSDYERYSKRMEEVVELIDAYNQVSGPLNFYVADRKGHDQRYAIDPTKANRELGWGPTTMFADGIKLTIQWYKEHMDWMAECTSGEYMNYYEQMYGNR